MTAILLLSCPILYADNLTDSLIDKADRQNQAYANNLSRELQNRQIVDAMDRQTQAIQAQPCKFVRVRGVKLVTLAGDPLEQHPVYFNSCDLND